jgi:hypothetical protein
MRNTIRLTLALALMLAGTAWSRAALADVFVTADIFKEKDVVEEVNIQIRKDITVIVNYNELDLIGDAEAHTLVNQRNEHNTVDGATTGSTDPADPGTSGELNFDLELDALITDSVSRNTGVIGVNQDVGNMVNQANAVSLGETVSTSSVTESQAHGEQVNVHNDVTEYDRLTWLADGITGDGEVVDGEPLDADDLAFAADHPERLDADKTANILSSINNNSGIVGVNQNAGNNNNQANGVAIAVGFGSHVALAEADLGQVNTCNKIFSFETLHTDLIQSSINDNSGVVTVNQTTGSNNNQGSMISFSALTTPIDVTVPGTGS